MNSTHSILVELFGGAFDGRQTNVEATASDELPIRLTMKSVNGACSHVYTRRDGPDAERKAARPFDHAGECWCSPIGNCQCGES